MIALGVCYTRFGQAAAPLRLPHGVGSLSLRNYGEDPSPRAVAIVSNGTTGDWKGTVFDWEYPAPTLIGWAGLLRRDWRPADKLGTVIVHGVDTGTASGFRSVGGIMAAVRRSLPVGKPPEWARMSYDGYVRPRYTKLRDYRTWVRPRADRLKEFQDETGRDSFLFIDVQNQWPSSGDEYGDGLELHSADTVRMQIDAAVSRGVSIVIFAGAATPTARTMIDDAILAACELVDVAAS